MAIESIGSALANPDRNIIFDGADIITRRGYTAVPNFLLDNSKISSGAKLVYVMLLKYAYEKDSCFPGQVRLAKDMGVSERYAHGCLKELERERFISIKRRGQGKSNLYYLHLRVHAN